MANVAETLRRIAESKRQLADTYRRTSQPRAARIDDDAAHCDSGARAWERLDQLAATNPWEHDHWRYQEADNGDFIKVEYHACRYCRTCAVATSDLHSADCLWQQARSLVTGQEER